jgi:hypothetical protein
VGITEALKLGLSDAVAPPQQWPLNLGLTDFWQLTLSKAATLHTVRSLLLHAPPPHSTHTPSGCLCNCPPGGSKVLNQG